LTLKNGSSNETDLVSPFFVTRTGFVTDLIVDAEDLRAHADKKAIDIEDIKLAITSKVAHSFIQPPPRQVRLIS